MWPFRRDRASDLQQGNRHFVEKSYEEAVACFVRHAEKCPSEAAKAYSAAGEASMRTNVVSSPQVVASGVSLVSVPNQTSAEAFFRMALRHDPTHFTALKGLAALLKKDSAERIELLQRAVDRQPDVLILTELGDYFRSVKKELETAYEYYRHAQEHRPRDRTPYMRLRDICKRMRRTDEAREWSQRWKEVDSSRKKRRT